MRLALRFLLPSLPIIFRHGFCAWRGLPPESAPGGVVGGVMRSLGLLGALPSSSIVTSPLPLTLPTEALLALGPSPGPALVLEG